MAKRWKKEDVTNLKRYAKKKNLEELADRFKTDRETVQKKLDELNILALDSPPKSHAVDPDLLKIYEQGLKAFHQKKWKAAADFFTRILDETDQVEFANRARRYLEMCRQQLEAAGSAPRDSDPFLMAVYERNRGNFEAALDLCSRGGRQGKDERFTYLAASLLAVMGEDEKAASVLAQAIELNPKNRIHAYHDSDFDSLRESSDHKQLFEQD
jgi:tetratricopeptide (TPR) repeat protein